MLESGRFAVGWGNAAALMGAEVEVLKGDWRRAIRPAEVEARLERLEPPDPGRAALVAKGLSHASAKLELEAEVAELREQGDELQNDLSALEGANLTEKTRVDTYLNERQARLLAELHDNERQLQSAKAALAASTATRSPVAGANNDTPPPANAPRSPASATYLVKNGNRFAPRSMTTVRPAARASRTTPESPSQVS
mgnify:CR=1 FL=1